MVKFHRNGILSVLFLLSLSLSPALDASNHPKFLMGISENDIRTTSGLMMTKLYPEAFRRMGIPVEMTSVPLSRLTVMVESGEIDGEISRVADYGRLHPNLVRVDEPVTDLSFSVYGSASKKTNAGSLEELAQKKYKVAYRRGVGVCEKAIESLFPERLSVDLSKTEQGLKQLKTGRVDFFCDITETVEFYLKSPAYSDAPLIQKAFDVGKAIPTYPFLNSKHKVLAPQMAQVLKEMKKEGLHLKYWNEADQALRSKWSK